MGNIFTVTCSSDNILTLFWNDCILVRVSCICDLEKNVTDLQQKLRELRAKGEDLNDAQQRRPPYRRRNELKNWISTVADEETRLNGLIAEKNDLPVGCCSFNNFKSTYSIAERVAQLLQRVNQMFSKDFNDLYELDEDRVYVPPDQTLERILTDIIQRAHVGKVGSYVLLFAVLISIIILRFKGDFFGIYSGFLIAGCVSFGVGYLVRLNDTDKAEEDNAPPVDIRAPEPLVEASRDSVTIEAEVRESILPINREVTTENAATIEESIQSLDTITEDAAMIEESIPSLDTITEDAATIEESIPSLDTITEDAATIEESIPSLDTITVDAAMIEESIQSPAANFVPGESSTL